MLPSKFGVNWLLGLEEAKNRFSRWLPWLPCWISGQHDFRASLESIGLSVQEKKRKIDFQDGGHQGFPIGTILAIFDLQVTLILPTKYRVNWPRGVGGVGF